MSCAITNEHRLYVLEKKRILLENRNRQRNYIKFSVISSDQSSEINFDIHENCCYNKNANCSSSIHGAKIATVFGNFEHYW